MAEARSMSARAREVVEWFGLSVSPGESGEEYVPGEAVVRAALPVTGRMHVITGSSGSGKSTLLGKVCEEAKRSGFRVIDLGATGTLEGCVVDSFGEEPVERVVSRLAWTGLAEPAVLLRSSSRLSTGERFRLGVARGVYEAERASVPVVLCCDEFTSTLDDGSAVACAGMLRRLLRNGATTNAGIVLATWREELLAYLEPHRVVRCDYGLWEVVESAETTNRHR